MSGNLFLSAVELARKIRDGEVSAAEALEDQIRHIHRHNPRINAIVTLDETDARARAREADEALAAGKSVGPLHGVPVTVKDTFETAGMRTTSGALPFSRNVPRQDAPVVARLRSAGAIILGKTNTPALADGAQTVNRVFGRTNNPWNVDCTSGGSSGGSAAAVAAGLSHLDVGSDIAGSIRLPAHFCGVYGLKPTGGRIPIKGHIASEHTIALPEELLWMLLLPCAGPIARSVEDLRLALGILGDPLSAAFSKRRDPPDGALRIAWTDSLPGIPVSKEMHAAVEDVAERLSGAGYEVSRQQSPGIDFEEAWELAGEVLGYLNTRFQPPITRSLRWLASKSSSAFIGGGGVLRGLVRGPGLSRRRRRALAERRERLIREIDAFLADWDTWLSPAYPTAAFTHRDRRSPIAVGKRRINQDLAEIAYNVVFNASGHPSVVLPAAIQDDGLPIGLQMIGRRWEDEELLDAAARLDPVFGGYHIPPGLLPS